MNFDEAFSKHQRVAFLCSGGKDSIAALYYMKDYWDKMVVCWVNTGDLCPHVESYMQKISQEVPNFVASYGDVRKWHEDNGWPSPIVPVDYTSYGQAVSGKKPTKICGTYECCQANIHKPVADLVKSVGATAVFTGARDADELRDPRPSGAWANGSQWFQAIGDWSDEEVFDYLRSIGITDPRFFGDDTSIDCLSCTGYPKYIGRAEYIKQHHPQEHQEVQRRYNLIKAVIISSVTPLDAAIEVPNEI